MSQSSGVLPPRSAKRVTHPVDEVLPVGTLAVYGVQHTLAFCVGR